MGRESIVWKYFIKLEKSTTDPLKVQCELCRKKLTFHASTSTLMKHLRTQHSREFKSSQEEENEKPNTINEDGTQTTQDSSSEPLFKKQMTMEKYAFQPVYSKESTTRKKINKSLINMVAKDTQPFSIVEDKGFQNFVHTLDPRYTLPSSKTLKQLMQDELASSLNTLKNELKDVQAVALTTDSWTDSMNSDSYLAITCHYVDSDYNMKTRLLELLKLTESHTANYLASCIDLIIKQWDLQGKVTSVTTDNAANITASIRLLCMRHIGCFAHTLNLAVKSAINAVPAVFEVKEKVKKIVTFLKKSTTAKHKLEEAQESLGRHKLKLIQDVETRWNSTFMMLERFLEVKEPLILALSNLTGSDLPQMYPLDWKIAKECLEVLKPFLLVTQEMSSEKQVSVSKMIPLSKSFRRITIQIANKFVDLDENRQENPTRTLALQLNMELNNRCKDYENSGLLGIATILDPRFKKLGFANMEKYEVLVRKLKAEVNTLQPQLHEITDPALMSNVEESSDMIWNELDKEVSKIQQSTLAAFNTSGTLVEVQLYLDKPNIPRSEDPLQFWLKNQQQFPHLATLAVKYLCAQATSVPCERIFSKAGEILSHKRSRLSYNNVRMCLLLKK